MTMSYTDLPFGAAVTWQAAVATVAALPAAGQTVGEVRLVLDTDLLYEWDGSSWIVIGGVAAAVAIGDTITSGTTGSLLFVGSGPVLAQDNANLFWDDTNNRLGVGINSSLTAKIQVRSGAAAETGLIVRGAAAQSATLQEWQNSSSVAGARVDSALNFSRPNGTQSEQFGSGASTGGFQQALAIGNTAVVTADFGVALGYGTTAAVGSVAIGKGITSAAYSVVVGFNNTSSTSGGINIGLDNVTSNRGSAIGNTLTANGFDQFVYGTRFTGINNFTTYMGSANDLPSDHAFAIYGGSSTTGRVMFDHAGVWQTSTDASRKARMIHSVYDTAAREAFRTEASGTAAMMGFLGAAAVVRQASGANLTNNVTAGGTDDVIADFTDLTTYANDAAAIRNDIYQLSRKLKQVNDALRLYGLLT